MTDPADWADETTPLHELYSCNRCHHLVTHRVANRRQFNRGRCHCGGDLLAIPDQVRQSKKKQGVL